MVKCCGCCKCWWTCRALLITFLAILANELRTHWYFTTLEKDDFSMLNLSPGDIPTTYYSEGSLEKLVTGWIDEFRLFRADHKVKQLDLSVLNTTLRASIMETHVHGHTALCPPLYGGAGFEDVAIINISDVLTTGEFYGSFSTAHNKEFSQMLADSMGTGFSLMKSQVENTFVSNTKQAYITASLHANPITGSLAVQYAGSKTWLFFSPEDVKDGFCARAVAGGLLPRCARMTAKPITYYKYVSQPGDLLFFPASWAHIVLSHPGPNLMLNYRFLRKAVLVDNPSLAFWAVVNRIFLGKNVAEESMRKKGLLDKPGFQLNPLYLSYYAQSQLRKACGNLNRTLTEADHTVSWSKADQQLTDLLFSG